MLKPEWRVAIEEACKAIGTYRPQFFMTYDILADTLAKLDQLQEEFENSDNPIIVMHTNRGGSTNLTQNPAIRLINDLKTQALTYLRECGLTAHSLKKINEQELQQSQQKTSPLAEALANLSKSL